jgi:hypothetical protein
MTHEFEDDQRDATTRTASATRLGIGDDEERRRNQAGTIAGRLRKSIDDSDLSLANNVVALIWGDALPVGQPTLIACARFDDHHHDITSSHSINRARTPMTDTTKSKPTKSMTGDIQLNIGSRAARKLGTRSTQRALKLSGYMPKQTIPTASTPNCRRNTGASGVRTSPVLPVAMCGSGLATFPMQPETPCGKSTKQNWPFPAGLSFFLNEGHGRSRPSQ